MILTPRYSTLFVYTFCFFSPFGCQMAHLICIIDTNDIYYWHKDFLQIFIHTQRYSIFFVYFLTPQIWVPGSTAALWIQCICNLLFRLCKFVYIPRYSILLVEFFWVFFSSIFGCPAAPQLWEFNEFDVYPSYVIYIFDKYIRHFC